MLYSRSLLVIHFKYGSDIHVFIEHFLCARSWDTVVRKKTGKAVFGTEIVVKVRKETLSVL